MQTDKVVLGLCQNKRVLATATISLISIAKGPIHQSFPLRNKTSKEIARVSFNAEMYQISDITFTPQSIRFVLESPKDAYFSVSMRVNAEQPVESQNSHITDRLNFIFENDDFGGARTPSLTYRTSIEGFRTAALQIKLWRYPKTGSILHTPSLDCECWIGIAKLFKEDKQNIYHMESSLFTSKEELTSHISEVPNRNSTDHYKFFSEELWYVGKRVGTVSGRVLITGLPVIYQMISGVNTENGYQIQDALLNPKKIYRFSNVPLPGEMQKILILTDQLKVFIRKGRHSVKSDFKDYKAHVKLLEEIICNLHKTHRESAKCFLYRGVSDLIKAQKALLDLGELLINYADFIQYDVKPYYFECLVKLNKRGELGLGYLSFNNESPKMYEKRREIAERYSHFLVEMLKFALYRMHFKGIEPKTQKFVEHYLAIAYFRIPAFRTKLLDCIKSKSFYPVNEWRGITMDLEEEIHDSELVPALDWPRLFYALLNKNTSNIKALDNEKWQQRISKRGLVFFRFIKKWARQINKEFVRANLPWNHIPGYNIVVKCFLIELKEREIDKYNEAMVEASISLLRNSNLLNPFLYILFNKTNIHCFQIIFSSFDILSSWFDSTYKYQRTLPKTLDISFLNKGLRIAIKNEVCLGVAKALWFVYRHFHMIRGNFRKKLMSDLILDEEFYRLFFHWSIDVRRMFYSLLLYRVISLKKVYFEPEPLSQQDLELILKTEDLITKAMQTRTGAKTPHIKAAFKDFRECKEGYIKWQDSITVSSIGENDKRPYGPFENFPYPAFNVVNNYQDFSEKEIEEW